MYVPIFFLTFSFSYDSNNESPEEQRSKHAKKSKKYKKHKKTDKLEKSSKSHKKHKKSRKRHRRQSDDDDSDSDNGDPKKSRSGVLSNKFTEIMQKASKDKNTVLKVEQQSNGNKFCITKPNIQTDPSSLVEEITKTIQNKVIPSMEVASSGSESEV